MTLYKSNIPKGFDSPIIHPKDAEQEGQWQKANRDWWESHPMRYDWQVKLGIKEFTKEFYLEIDRRFFEIARLFLPDEKVPFESLIDFASLINKDVLEIGIGNGSHAQLLTSYAKSFTGIDITEYAVKSTLERMKCFGLNSRILRMDAEQMAFDDNIFDFIWSWGVIHHSANTRNVLKEIKRVLRPGGQAVVMIYHRNFWNYYLLSAICRGIFLGELFKGKSLHKIVQNWTDGAIARYYSVAEWSTLCSEFFNVLNITVLGQKGDLFPLPGGKTKNIIMKLIPAQISNFLITHCKMGTFLVATLEKQL